MFKNVFFFIVFCNVCSAVQGMDFSELGDITPLQKEVRLSYRIESRKSDSVISLNLHQLTEDIYVFQDSTFVLGTDNLCNPNTVLHPNNFMIIKLSDKELLIIDTPYTIPAMELVMRWLDKTFPGFNITAINTHAHADRTGGNEVLLKRGVPIWGSDKTVEEGRNHEEEERIILTRMTAKHPKLSAFFTNHKFHQPTHTFSLQEGKKLQIAGKAVDIIYPGPGHTVDNVVVHIPHLKLLFGGCFLLAKPNILITHQTALALWPQSLETLEKLSLDAEWVIPGHPHPKGGKDFSPVVISYTKSAIARVFNSKK